MAINKVVFGNQTLLDLTSDTIQANKLLQGYTAHDATGASIVGTYQGGGEGYTINLTASSSELYGQNIIVSYEGQTVTTIQFSNVGTASIVVQEEGAYNFAVSYGGLTYYCDVNVISAIVTYNEIIYYYPNGSTVTPINDVQIWISCADVRDKNYTTLAEVLADTQLLATLMSSENAVDYLVRCEWYGKALVPTMTSNTTPEGECFANYAYVDASFAIWKAFNGNKNRIDGGWSDDSGAASPYLGYEFVSPKTVSGVELTIYTRTYSTINNFKAQLQGSNDGETYTNIGSQYSMSGSGSSEATLTFTWTVDNSVSYKYYRLAFNQRTTNTATDYTFVVECQFFTADITANQTAMQAIGSSDYASNTLTSDSDWCTAIANSTYRESILNVKVPTMTSNTTPSGEASASGVYSSSYPAWNAFDGIYPPATTTAWVSPATNDTVWIKYRFSGKQVRICSMMVFPTAAPSTLRVKTFTLKGSNDDSAYTELFTHQFPQDNTLVKANYFGFVQANSYEYFKVELPDFWSSNQRGFIELQLYGRENGGVQNWLRAGGIDKDYLTLAEVLADSTTLSALMASQSAVDYLVTCKGWATTICANQSAMQYIGLNNYCANTLLADSDWLNAIVNSAYMESVLNVKVPTMTSATTPSGVVSGLADNDYPVWYAFDGNDSTRWVCTDITSPYIQYQFSNAKRISVLSWKAQLNAPFLPPTSMTISGSNDGTNFVTLKTITDITADANEHKASFVNSTDYTYYKIACATRYYQNHNYVVLAELQFYGREDVPQPEPQPEKEGYKISITAPSGSSIVATKDLVIISDEVGQSGTVDIIVPSTGVWDITATLGTKTASRSVTISPSTLTLAYTSEYKTVVTVDYRSSTSPYFVVVKTVDGTQVENRNIAISGVNKTLYTGDVRCSTDSQAWLVITAMVALTCNGTNYTAGQQIAKIGYGTYATYTAISNR